MRIILQNISKNFGTEIVLEDFCYELKNNEKYHLVGKNGSGKTTLLKILAGILLPSEGNILIHEKKKTSNIKIAYIDNNVRSFFLRLSSIQNLYYFAALDEISREKVDYMVNNQFKNFNIHKILNLAMNQLSLGQIQIINLIRGMMVEPDLILIDEGLSGLDNEKYKNSLEYIEKISSDREVISVIASHENRTNLSKNFEKIIL